MTRAHPRTPIAAPICNFDTVNCTLSVQSAVQLRKWLLQPTNITPDRRDNVDIVVPDNAVHEHNEVIERDPYCVHADSGVPGLSTSEEGQQSKHNSEKHPTGVIGYGVRAYMAIAPGEVL